MSDPATAAAASPRIPRPWHFFFLVLPYGVSFGFVSVALPYVARERGISVGAIGGLVAAAFEPHAWKFLWAPIVDTTLTRKAWYLMGLVLIAVGTFASMAMPIAADSLGTLTTVVVASQLGLTLLYMACEGTLGRAVPAEAKATAASRLQAGTFLGLGVGGGIAIELVTHLSGAAAGAIIAATLLLCAFPLFLFDEPPADEERHVGRALRDLFKDLWALLRSRPGVMAIVLALSSVGAGAASGLFGALAEDWHVSRELVELTNGWLGGHRLGARRRRQRVAHQAHGPARRLRAGWRPHSGCAASSWRSRRARPSRTQSSTCSTRPSPGWPTQPLPPSPSRRSARAP